ncbi:hypothetical protein [Janthinobacterium sp. 17J80-10]|uniref:pilus assembly PilX family protein n=1 Tax=Janthinobacterium sp. 17J80-10 TaxID=2497863 RepID=UPI0010055C43|nr:hypothetical protein [Janthinobacterium sp. 17J80-10]QAU33792.1 hypothetical protein EKL02_06115 [Janthinobacterium sp. 17J80-10]
MAYYRKPLIRQDGIVLVIALIVLVALTLSGIALMRSVDTGNLIAGNMAFQQSAVRSGDVGVEAAVTWLDGVKGGADPAQLNASDSTNGYVAMIENPASGQSWDAFWTATLAAKAVSLAQDEAGNTVSYIIHRMCATTGIKAGASCSDSAAVKATAANAEEGGQVQLNTTSAVYFRITVRTAGPRGTVSYVQAVVAA